MPSKSTSFPADTRANKLILILPTVSHPFIRLALQLLKGPGTFSLYIIPALTPKNYHVTIHNQRLFWPDKLFVRGALVGISCVTANAKESYRLADRFRKAGSTVIMGGSHVTQMPEEALQHCDSVVVGEAESVWPQVIKDYEQRTLKTIYEGELVKDYFSMSFDFFRQMDPLILYQTGLILSRGCKYRCEFCSPPQGQVRFIQLEQAMILIKQINSAAKRPFGIKPTLILRDDNIFSNPAYAKALFKELIPLNLHWIGNSSIDIAYDNEAIQLAKDSGCTQLFIGFESIIPKSLQKTSIDQITSSEDYIRVIRKLRKNGIKVIGAFILGSDYCTHTYYLKLIIFILRARLFIVSLTILTPFPGSPLYKRLTDENRITCHDWQRYNGLFDVVFKPKHMSALALQCWYVAIRTIGIAASSFFYLTLIFLAAAYLSGILLGNIITILKQGAF